LYPGPFDPGPLTRGGPRGHVGGQAGLVGWATLSTTGSQASSAASHGGGYGAEEGGGKGAAEPGAHREPAGGFGLAGGWPEMTNFGGGGAHFWRGIRDGGGDSGHLGSIP
jgi:hypothetical protein